MEQIYILNDNGTVLGTKDRLEAHKQGLLHAGVQCWVMNENGEVLVQRRANPNKASFGKWDVSFGGHCTPCPSDTDYLIANVIKEGQEELGLTLTAKDIIKLGEVRYRSQKSKNNELIAVFLTHTQKNHPFVFEDGEVSEVKWIDPAQLRDNIIQKPDEYANRLKAVALLAFYQA